MVLEIAVIDVKPGQELAFEKDVTAAAPALVAAKGCRKMEIMRSIERPSRYRLLVEWDSIDDHFEVRKSDAILPLRDALTAYAETRGETEHMSSIFSSQDKL